MRWSVSSSRLVRVVARWAWSGCKWPPNFWSKPRPTHSHPHTAIATLAGPRTSPNLPNGAACTPPAAPHRPSAPVPPTSTPQQTLCQTLFAPPAQCTPTPARREAQWKPSSRDGAHAAALSRRPHPLSVTTRMHGVRARPQASDPGEGSQHKMNAPRRMSNTARDRGGHARTPGCTGLARTVARRQLCSSRWFSGGLRSQEGAR